MSELEQATELQMYLQLSDLLLRPARLQPALCVCPEPPDYPFGCAELANCNDAEGPPRQLTEDASFSISLPGEQPAQIERALQQCASLVRVTTQPSTPDSSRHQAHQAALCQMILAEKANLEQMQSVLQSTMIGYTIAGRKGALLQQTLNRIQPSFVGLRRETASAERRAADLATEVQDLQQSLQTVQRQRDNLTGQVQTLQEEKTTLTERVEELEGDQGHLSDRVLQLERQNATLDKDAASLQEMLHATNSKQQEEVATREHFQMENEVLRRKVAYQEQQMATQAQKLEAQEQRECEEGEAVKGQEQQVMNLEQQVVKLEQQVEGLHSKLKDEQQGKAAAVKAHEEEVQKLQRHHQSELAGQRSQIEGLQQSLVAKTQAQTAAIQDLASQLSDSTHVNSRQGAELSAKEAQVEKLDGELTAKQAQVKRLDGELSEQQGQVHQLQTLASEKTSEVERLTPQLAEKQGDIEKREGVMRQFATHLRSSQQQVAAEKQDKDSAVHAYSLVAQEDEAKIAALELRLKKEQKGKADAAVVMQAKKAVVHGLKRQLAEQQTKSNAELAARCSEIHVLQQSLAAKSEQHDRLAEDYKDTLQAQNTELQRPTAQLAEQQCVVEVKQAEISKQVDRLTSSQQEVAAVHQQKASVVQAYHAAFQVHESKIAELDLRLKKEQQDKADAVKVNKAAIEDLQHQLQEKQSLLEDTQVMIDKKQSLLEGKQVEIEKKQSLLEDKQGMIDSLGSHLTASIDQVSTVRQELASVQKAHSADTQEYEHRASVLSNMLLQQDSAAGEQKELIHDLTQRLLTTACEASGLHQQGGSSRMVDDELDAEELHLGLHHSESWAGASSSQRHGSSSSELASSEQGQGTPKRALYEEQSNFGSDSEMGPLGSPAGPQSNEWGPGPSSSEQEQDTPSNGWGSDPSSSEQGQGTPTRALYQEQGNFGSDSEMGPSGFTASPQRDGWDSEPSSSAAASEQHDDGMGLPGFPGNPNRRSMDMAAAQSDRQQQGHEELEEEGDPSMAAQQNLRRFAYRGGRGGNVARMGKKGPARCTATAAGTGWETTEGDPGEWKVRN